MFPIKYRWSLNILLSTPKNKHYMLHSMLQRMLHDTCDVSQNMYTGTKNDSILELQVLDWSLRYHCTHLHIIERIIFSNWWPTNVLVCSFSISAGDKAFFWPTLLDPPWAKKLEERFNYIPAWAGDRVGVGHSSPLVWWGWASSHSNLQNKRKLLLLDHC